MRWVENVACIEGLINAFKTFVKKYEGRRSLGRLKWEYNLKMDLKEID